MDVCILTIIKNEQEYIKDFVKYHLNMGIDHIFFIEDYGSMSHLPQINSFSDNNVTLLSIDNIIKEENKERIDYCLKNNSSYQGFVLKNGLDFIKENTNYDWCFIIDIDEYITIAKKLTESGTIIMNIHCLKLALRTTIPVFMGYISCGIAFGLVTVNAGYP